MQPVFRCFIIPGGAQQVGSYDILLRALIAHNIEPVPIDIAWITAYSSAGERQSFVRYVNEARRQIESARPTPNDIVIGFSYGGIIALILKEFSFMRGFICSTPEIRSDILQKIYDRKTKVPINWSELRGIAFDELCHSRRLSIFVSSNEAEPYKHFAQQLARYNDTQVIEFNGAEHKTFDALYVATIIAHMEFLKLI